MKSRNFGEDVHKYTSILTIITPVYNGERYVEETIRSVLDAAKEFPVDYVVVDDGSTDSTPERLQKYGNSLRIFRQENQGEAAAVNFGLQMARGKYCIIVNSDDPILTSELFKYSVENLESNSHLVATYPDWYVIDETGEQLEMRVVKDYSLIELAGYSNCLPGPGACFRRETALIAGGRNSKYRYVSDYDLWLRLSIYGDFMRIPQPLAQWRFHKGSTSSQNSSVGMAMERIEVIKEYLASSNVTNKFQRMALSHAYYYAARLALSSRDVPGRTLLLKSIWARKKWPERAKWLVVASVFFAPISTFLYRLVESKLPNRYRLKL